MHDALFADQYHLEAPDLEQRATATGVNKRAYLTRWRNTNPPRGWNGTCRAASRAASRAHRPFSSMASGITGGGMRAACGRRSRLSPEPTLPALSQTLAPREADALGVLEPGRLITPTSPDAVPAL